MLHTLIISFCLTALSTAAPANSLAAFPRAQTFDPRFKDFWGTPTSQVASASAPAGPASTNLVLTSPAMAITPTATPAAPRPAQPTSAIQPAVAAQPANPAAPASFVVLPAQIEAIDPWTRSCNRPLQHPSECRDSTVAAKAITDSFVKYKITSPRVAAALVSLIVYESDSLSAATPYNGPYGKGTRNMQTPEINKKYAQYLQQPLDVVLSGVDDDVSFGSAAWYFTTQCGTQARKDLETKSGDAGWNSYLQCVQTSADEKRKQYWHNALQAMAGGM